MPPRDRERRVYGSFNKTPALQERPFLRSVEKKEHTSVGQTATSRERAAFKRLVRLLFKKLFVWGFFAGLAGALILVGYVLWISRMLPDPDKLASPDRAIEQSTKIYDRTGQVLLYEYFNEEKRTLVELNDIPEYAVQATIAVEDKFFFEHKGVRWISVLRAQVSNLLGRRTGSGGASTLTQQLIKNAIVGDESTYRRKIKEAILATRLEKKYTKEQILKLYFNEIPYGSTNYGIAAASQSYFNKNIKDINLSEAAILAAMPKAPSRYLNNFDLLKTRRDFILGLMVEQGYITQEQADEAKKEPVKLRKTIGDIKAPHFSLYVKELLAERFGEAAAESAGYKVYTTLDMNLQKIAEEEVGQGIAKVEKQYSLGNGALVALDPHTGEVLAYVGSRDFFDDEHDGKVDVPRRLRQPGSSMKPLVYLAGLEKGYTMETVLTDVLINFDVTGEKPYEPHNYDGKERGFVTAKASLQMSLNIPAVQMTYLVGVQNVLDFFEKLGYSTFKDRSRFGLSIVLGGGEVMLLEHVAAYAALANEGTYHTPHAILKIEDSKGNVVFETEKTEGAKVVDRNLVASLTDTLTNDALRAPVFGAGSALTLPDRPVAAKTGTTNDYRDGWTLGYTPSLAAGVWVGNNDNTPMNKAGGSIGAAPIWNGFMRRALQGTPVEQFPEAPANTAVKPVLRGSDSGGVRVLIDSISGKLATSSTPKEFVKEKIFVQPHSILHYVVKDNPQGPAPEDPTKDSQYTNWETALQTWMQKQIEAGVIFDTSEPPTEYDDIHLPQLAPRVRFIAPADGAVVTDRVIALTLDVSAPRGVARVEYDLDNKKIGEVASFPFGLTFNAKQVENGVHTLSARAYDDVGNTASTTIAFTLKAPPPPPDVVWKSPRNGSSFGASAFPVTLRFDFVRPEALVDVELFAQKEGAAERVSIGTLNSFSPNTRLVWQKAPEPGVYMLIPVVLDGTGKKLEGESIKVQVR